MVDRMFASPAWQAVPRQVELRDAMRALEAQAAEVGRGGGGLAGWLDGRPAAVPAAACLPLAWAPTRAAATLAHACCRRGAAWARTGAARSYSTAQPRSCKAPFR
jgi:hypothetical protein